MRKSRQHRYAVKDWANRMADIPAFLLGNAPSLNDHDLSLLSDYFTIGINRTFYVLDPTVLFWQDIGLWHTEYHNLQKLEAVKVARDVADPRRCHYNYHVKGIDYVFGTKPHILQGRGSTGPLACQFAVALGCRPLILLGMDCECDAEGNTDFYGVNPHHRPHTMDNCRDGLKFIREFCPVEVISCGQSSLWPSCRLEDVLATISAKHKRNRSSYKKQLLGK